MAKLTRKQKRLITEIEELLTLFNLGPRHIIDKHTPGSWTPRLELAKNQIVRSEIIMWYTLIDEFLNTRIAQCFFGKKRPFPSLWRTKRFQLFNYYVLEELSLLAKLRLVRAIAPLPKAVVADIEKLNALRNGVVHAYFPENLRKSRPEWKGQDVFSLEGVSRLKDDMQLIIDYFLPSIPHAVSPKKS